MVKTELVVIIKGVFIILCVCVCVCVCGGGGANQGDHFFFLLGFEKWESKKN